MLIAQDPVPSVGDHTAGVTGVLPHSPDDTSDESNQGNANSISSRIHSPYR